MPWLAYNSSDLRSSIISILPAKVFSLGVALQRGYGIVCRRHVALATYLFVSQGVPHLLNQSDREFTWQSIWGGQWCCKRLATPENTEDPFRVHRSFCCTINFSLKQSRNRQFWMQLSYWMKIAWCLWVTGRILSMQIVQEVQMYCDGLSYEI